MTVLTVVVMAMLAASLSIVFRSLRPKRNPGAEVNSGVDAFRRHMDALSPEARRNVIDKVEQTRRRARHAAGQRGE